MGGLCCCIAMLFDCYVPLVDIEGEGSGINPDTKLHRFAGEKKFFGQKGFIKKVKKIYFLHQYKAGPWL